MKFEKFEILNPTEALDLLNRFREWENDQILEKLIESGIVQPFFTIESLAPFLIWVSLQLQYSIGPLDESVPLWIRETAEHKDGRHEFVESSRLLISTAAFYLGETFVRSFSTLEWGIGEIETLLFNMPVVRGFDGNQELPPLLVLENIYGRIIKHPERTGDIDRMVRRWQGQVPEK